MYKTSIYNQDNKNRPGHKEFDWEMFFSRGSAEKNIEKLEPGYIISRAREHLKENKFRLTLALDKMMGKLLKGSEPHNPRTLELGAATGVLTRWFIEKYGGTGVLVDNSEASFQAYNTMKYDLKKYMTYIKTDLFKLELEERFDWVCSFGLMEHFEDKKNLIEVHKRFVVPGGMIVIIILMDTPLTRTFFELYPELNLGYRELLKEREIKDILTRHGLEITRTRSSSGYSYDFLGSLCKIAS